jgi:spermidine synthase
MNKKLLIIGILFILSGLASLIYQVVWFKQLSYFLGNSTYSQSIVLATFMGGLAIGAYYWGKKSDNSQNKLRTFAILEICIAIYCFLFPLIFSFAEILFIETVQSFGWSSDSIMVLVTKFILSSVILMPPTILMGGTLPVLVNFLNYIIPNIGKHISMLYFLNSIGAMIGTFLAGFYLLQSLGLKSSLVAGAGIELFVGIAALLFSKIWTQKENFQHQDSLKHNAVESTLNISKIALWAAGLTGFAAMMLEVIWFRLLIPVLSSSTYSFTLIIGSFIGGISLGSLIVFFIEKKIKNYFILLGVCQLGVVVSIVLTLPFYGKIPFITWSSIVEESSYFNYLFLQFRLVFFLLVIPTIFMGMSLPIAARLVANRKSAIGQSVGNVFAINTFGTVLGSLAAGLIFIPIFGILNSLFLTIGIYLAVAIWIFMNSNINKKSLITGAIGLIVFLFFIQKNANISSWKYTIMLSEVPRKINRTPPPKDYKSFLKLVKNHDKILFYKEGINGTFIVAQTEDRVYLFTNGKGDANSYNDLRTQVNLGQIPMVLHPNPESVLVIGLGAGTTVGNVLLHEVVKFAQVAEISNEVVSASKYFEHVNHKPLSDKRLQVIRDDGVSALKLSPLKYDVIISQPSNPWSAGVGNLFTKEFFKACKSKLKPNGYVAQWMNLYETDDQTLKMVLRTMLSEFDHVNLWHIGKSDILMICSENPITRNLDVIESRFNFIKDYLKPININSFASFLSQEMIFDRSGIEEYVGEGPINTQNLPLLEYWSPKAYFYNSTPDNFIDIDERKKIENSNLLLANFIRKKEFTEDDILEAGLFQSTGGNKELAFYLANINPDVYDMWAKKVFDLGDFTNYELYTHLSQQRRKEQGNENKTSYIQSELSEAYYQQGSNLMSQNNFDAAINYLKAAIRIDSMNINAYINLATVYGKKQQFILSIETLNKAQKHDPKEPKIYFNRGYAKGFIADENGAIKDFSQCIEISPKNGMAYLMRGQVYLALKNKEAACSDFQQALSLGETRAAAAYQENCR